MYLHSGLQRSPARVRLQFPLQETTQPQWSEHALLTSSRSIQYGIHRLFLMLHSQPQSLWFGIAGVWASDCFQMNAAVSKVRFACARDAACDVSQCWGWMGFFVMAMRVSVMSEKIHAMHSIFICFPWSESYPTFIKAAFLEEVHDQHHDVTVCCPQVGLCMTCYAAWLRWSNIRVPASCFQGTRSADLLACWGDWKCGSGKCGTGKNARVENAGVA